MNTTNLHTTKSLYQFIKNDISPTWHEEAEPIARILLIEVFDLRFLDIIADKKLTIKTQEQQKLDDILGRLHKLEPIQYILGKTHFLEREFNLSPDVLIPRPETEELVLHILKNVSIPQPRILDIGVGSGCIGVSLSIGYSIHQFTGLDKSKGALKIAESNAKKFGITMQPLCLDILRDDIPSMEFDIIVSNPPYVEESEKEQMRANVLDYEPSDALFVKNAEPLIFYERITDLAYNHLKKNGYLFFEINEKYGTEISQLLKLQNFGEVHIIKDIHGKDRFVGGFKYL